MFPQCLSLFLGNLILLQLVGAATTHWNYEEQVHWGDTYPACKGNQQSPINLNSNNAVKNVKLPPIKFANYDKAYNLTVKNNGHSVQVDIPDSVEIGISGGAFLQKYTLRQLHFHWESEHLKQNKSFPLEVHFVHAIKGLTVDSALTHGDGLAVIGVFFEIGKDASPLASIAAAIPKLTTATSNTVVYNLKLSSLLPADKSVYWRYVGSLTTPPCTESVWWTVYDHTLSVTQDQVNMFKTIKDDEGDVLHANNRLVQAVGHRKLTVKMH